ncbi:Opine dehydrogenase [Gracilaria domingensis]|nr:Opine dehydrogenase [Gracilaria domingensis]
MWKAHQIKQICVVGGGNAAQVLAALLGNAQRHGSTVRVSVLAPFGDESERLFQNASKNGGITLENPDGSLTKGMPDIITDDPKKALLDTQIVLLPLPTFAIPPMLKLIAPHLESGCWVGALPAQGGFQWIAADILDTSEQGKNIKIFGLDKLPYNCRTKEYGKRIKVFGYKEDLALSCIPNKQSLASNMASTISDVIPKLNLYTVPNFLVLTLATSNQCIHPARMYGMFSKSTVIDRVPLFYEEMDEFSANLIHQVSEETLSIARAMEGKSEQLGKPMDLSRVLSIADSTTKVYEVRDKSSLKRIFQTCAGFEGIATPLKKGEVKDGVQMYEVDWNCRYFTEDIPALCVLRGLAELLNVKTSTIDMLIKWAQKSMDGAYQFITEDKLNTDREKLMYTPQYWGITDSEQLVRFHS